MPSFSWAANVGGNWNTGTLWTPISVPNTATADVMIDATATLAAYTTAIASGETDTVNSMRMNGTNNRVGSYTRENHLDAELDRMLVFAGGSAGAFGGSLQTYVHERSGASAAIVNGGTLNAFIQVEGGICPSLAPISNEIGALAGTMTIAAPIRDVAGDTPTDGLFSLMGPGAVIDLGGASAGHIVNIVTIAALFGWTELNFDGPTAAVDEWTGSKDIGAGSVNIIGGSDHISTSSLTNDPTRASSLFGGAMLNPQAGTVSIAGKVRVNDVIVPDYGTIAPSDQVLTPVTSSSRTRPS
jgi:hypothetical protein